MTYGSESPVHLAFWQHCSAFHIPNSTTTQTSHDLQVSEMCTMLLFKLLVLATIFSTIEADTPANCTFEDVKGTWTFYIGENGNDNTIKCDSSFKVVTELRVHLLFPDVVLDDNYSRGFWTMIYNQGFEVVLNGTKYFAFSKYVGSVSYCDKTLPGWSHDAQDVSQNWACYYGKLKK